MGLKKTVTCHYDAGHAWFAVPKNEVIASGAPITHFSYMDDEYVYLEEDWDITQFINAIGGIDNFNRYYDVVEKDDGDRSPIRNLRSYSP